MHSNGYEADAIAAAINSHMDRCLGRHRTSDAIEELSKDIVKLLHESEYRLVSFGISFDD